MPTSPETTPGLAATPTGAPPKAAACFRARTRSPEFTVGHRRGFDDLRRARATGSPASMASRFITSDIVAH